CLLLYGGAVLV
nr:immunoglobulin light chain junction region [Macaca mulatta]